MKTNAKNKLPVDFFERKAACAFSIQNSKFGIQNRVAFTLIELLVVISIIALLAALTFPVLGSLKRREYISRTQAELSQLETAIESYKATYGFYPPDSSVMVGKIPINQLYYELLGVTNNSVNFVTLDGSGQPIPVSSMVNGNAFGPSVSGFINVSKSGGAEDAPAAKDFLPSLKPNQIGRVTNMNNVAVTILITSAGGPDSTYQPLNTQDLNPWRYNSSSPTNDPGSYDLWVQLRIAGKTNLVCNWSKQIQINSPLP